MPKGITRIRHYGLLADRIKHELLPRCRHLLGAAEPQAPQKKTTAEWLLRLLGVDVTRCPRCGYQPLERRELPPLRSRRTPAPVALAVKPLEDTS